MKPPMGILGFGKCLELDLRWEGINFLLSWPPARCWNGITTPQSEPFLFPLQNWGVWIHSVPTILSSSSSCLCSRKVNYLTPGCSSSNWPTLSLASNQHYSSHFLKPPPGECIKNMWKVGDILGQLYCPPIMNTLCLQMQQKEWLSVYFIGKIKAARIIFAEREGERLFW